MRETFLGGSETFYLNKSFEKNVILVTNMIIKLIDILNIELNSQ